MADEIPEPEAKAGFFHFLCRPPQRPLLRMIVIGVLGLLGMHSLRL